MMNRQKGAAMVEFAIIALWFFAVLFSAIEVGRWMFNWNTLVEATRRGARIAAVCPLFDPYIRVATVFGDRTRPDDAQNSPILNGLDTADVTIAYYRVDSDGTGGGTRICFTSSSGTDPLSPTGDACAFNSTPSEIDKAQIKLVNVSIAYNHRFIAPIIGGILGDITAPTYNTLMPIESFESVLQRSPNLCFP